MMAKLFIQPSWTIFIQVKKYIIVNGSLEKFFFAFIM